MSDSSDTFLRINSATLFYHQTFANKSLILTSSPEVVARNSKDGLGLRRVTSRKRRKSTFIYALPRALLFDHALLTTAYGKKPINQLPIGKVLS